MGFSDQELKAIGEVQRLLRGHLRGWMTLEELARAVIHEIAMSDAERIAPQCLAILPREARPYIEACLDRLASSDFRADLVMYVGPGLSDEEKTWLRPRYRGIAQRIIEHDREFEGREVPPDLLAVPEVDLFWEKLRGMRSVGGPKCRSEGCDEPTVRVSVYCARHHYERIAGKSASDY